MTNYKKIFIFINIVITSKPRPNIKFWLHHHFKQLTIRKLKKNMKGEVDQSVVRMRNIRLIGNFRINGFHKFFFAPSLLSRQITEVPKKKNLPGSFKFRPYLLC